MRVIVEVLVPEGTPAELGAISGLLADAALSVDEGFEPSRSGGAPGGGAIYTIRGDVDESKRAELEGHPHVHAVWNDTPIEPFGSPGF